MDGQRNYKKLVAWQRAHELTLKVYATIRSFPREELYGLTSQVRRAAFSVGANIAEGSGRKTNPDFLRFLYIALGSLKETEYAMLVAKDLDYISAPDHAELTILLNQTSGVLQGLINSLDR